MIDIPIKEVSVHVDTLEMASRVSYLYKGKLIPISEVPTPLLTLLDSVVEAYMLNRVACDKEVYISSRDNTPVTGDLIEPRIRPSIILDRLNNVLANSRHLKSLCLNCMIQSQVSNREMVCEYVMYYCKLFCDCPAFNYLDIDGFVRTFNLKEFAQKMCSDSDEDNIEACKQIMGAIRRY